MIRVLVVEDIEDEALLLYLMIQKAGFVTSFTLNPFEGIHMAQHNQIDVLVTDIGMPVVDGFEVIKHVRSVNKKIPIVVISSYVEGYEKMRAFQLGANYFIEKPFEREDLLRVMKNIKDELSIK